MLAGCAHEAPFSHRDPAQDTSRTRGPTRQLTYNLGTDLRPAWSDDGSSLWYSAEDLSRDDQDRCLGRMPQGGGTLRDVLCGVTLASLDSVDAFYEPAPGPGGRLLYLREATMSPSVTPATAGLVLADEERPGEGRVIRTFPYTASSGLVHDGIAFIRWLSADQVIYLAQDIQYIAPCRGCPLDTLRTGLELVRVDLAGDLPVFSLVPGSAGVSSVSRGGSADELYYTLNGDTRVYRMLLSTGVTEIVHDFGPGRIARDVSVSGTRMFVIVGAQVTFVQDSILGTIQRDLGGELRMVDLTNGSDTRIILDLHFFRRPAAHPSGSRVVAETYFAPIVGCGPGCADTTVIPSSDLWLFEVP